jgi:hypothetical protein
MLNHADCLFLYASLTLCLVLFFLNDLFDLANVSSQALQASDTDLAAAATTVDNLKQRCNFS